MGKRGFGSREREQSVAAIAGDDSVWGLLGCGLLFFIRMEGELPRRHGWFAEHCFDARRQVGDGVGHVNSCIFQAIEGLRNKGK